MVRAGGVVDPVKIFLTSSLITVHNLLAISHAVCAHVGGPKILETLGSRHLQMATWMTHRNAFPPHVLPYQILSV